MANSDPKTMSMEQIRVHLRLWEKEFEQSHGRRPTKSDIDKCSRMVIFYKQYRNLKKKAQKKSDENRTSNVEISNQYSLQSCTSGPSFKSPSRTKPEKSDVAQANFNSDEEVKATPNAKQGFSLFGQAAQDSPLSTTFSKAKAVQGRAQQLDFQEQNQVFSLDLNKKSELKQSLCVDADKDFIDDEIIDCKKYFRNEFGILYSAKSDQETNAPVEQKISKKLEDNAVSFENSPFLSPIARPQQNLKLKRQSSVEKLPKLDPSLFESPSHKGKSLILEKGVDSTTEEAGADSAVFAQKPPVHSDDEPFREDEDDLSVCFHQILRILILFR